MRILIAEDESVSRLLLERTLQGWGYEVIAVADGLRAWGVLQQPDAPRIAILDWEMPGLSGTDVCDKVRQVQSSQPTYLLLLTGREGIANLVAGLESGANDYLTKPFNRDELRARLQVARRVVELQASLAERVRELEQALAQVKQLRGLLPICAWCKRIRSDQDYWLEVEEYMGTHSDLRFSHGMCPDCLSREIQKLPGTRT